jgi:hypothetical protein
MIRRFFVRIAKIVPVALGICVVVCCSNRVSLWAQKAQNTQPAAGGDALQKSEAAKAKQRVTQLKKLKLIEVLDMNEQTAEKFFVRYNADQKKVDDALKALNTSMRELDNLLAQDPKKVSVEQLKALNDQILEKQGQMQAVVAERLRSLRSVLDERQYAKFLLFEAKFQDQLRKTLLDVKRDSKNNPEQAPQTNAGKK